MESELLAIAMIVKEMEIKSSFVRNLKIVELLRGAEMSWLLVDKVEEILETL